MLLITGNVPPPKETLKIDEYTFSIEWGEWVPKEVIYWRTGDLRRSFIEIGINENSKTIMSATLLLAENVYSWSPSYSALSKLDIPHQLGLPRCGLDKWPVGEVYFDDPDIISIRISSDSLRIELGALREVSRCLTTEKTSFGVDNQGFLHLLEIYNLSDREISLVKQAFPPK